MIGENKMNNLDINQKFFDIAYKNKARPLNMLTAILYALKMSNNYR